MQQGLSTIHVRYYDKGVHAGWHRHSDRSRLQGSVRCIADAEANAGAADTTADEATDGTADATTDEAADATTHSAADTTTDAATDTTADAGADAGAAAV